MEQAKPKNARVLALIACLVAAIVALGIALGILKPGNPYIAFHQWQMDRSTDRFVANPDEQGVIEQIEYHRDRLVAAGVYKLFEYTFNNIDSSSAEAREIVQLIIKRKTPPHEEFISLAPQRSRPLKISILCTPDNLDAWKKFVAAKDTPPEV